MADNSAAAAYYEEDEVVYKEDCELYENEDDDHHQDYYDDVSQTQPSQQQQQHPQRRAAGAAALRRHQQRWSNQQQQQQQTMDEYHNENGYYSQSDGSGTNGYEEGDDDEEENPFLALDALVRQHQMNQQQQQQQQQDNNLGFEAETAALANEQSCVQEAVVGPQHQDVGKEEREPGRVLLEQAGKEPSAGDGASFVATASGSNNFLYDSNDKPAAEEESAQSSSRQQLQATTTTEEAAAAGRTNESKPDATKAGSVPTSLLSSGTTGGSAVAAGGLFSTNNSASWLDNENQKKKKRDAVSSSSSVLEASRRFIEKKKRRLRDANNDSRSTQPTTTTKKATSEKPVGVERSKLSIVGTRPKHWGSRKANTMGLGHAFGKFTNTQRTHLRSELARTENARKHKSQKNPSSLSATNDAKQPSVRRQDGDATTPKSSNDSESAAPAAAAAAVTFAPSFLASRTASTKATAAVGAADDVEDNDYAQAHFQRIHQQNNMTPQSRLPAFGSPTPPRRGSSTRKHYRGRHGGGGGGAGPLLKRLRQIRDSIKGDAIRFQSGQYPFKATSFDMNDPRNRAKSYMDVTILGGSVPWEKEYQKLTFLGFVHTHHHKTQCRSVNAPDPQSCLAWMCFTFDTAREKNLQAGTNLRVYNPIMFPLNKTAPGAALAELDASSANEPLGEQQGQPEVSTEKHQQPSRAVVDWMVVNTEVCENYPDSLPKLPDRDTLTAQLNVDGKTHQMEK